MVRKRVLAIVPARLDSARLPRKALIEVAGGPIIEHVLVRVKAIPGITDLVCATTKRTVDDELAERVMSMGVDVYRGEVDDDQRGRGRARR